MIGVGDRFVLSAYVVTVALGAVELWLLRGTKTAKAARDRRQALGWILMMTMLPVAVYQDRLTTAEALVLTAVAVGPGIGLYWSGRRGRGPGSGADTG